MASLKMDINRLKKDELIYELTVRGVTGTDTKTVEELRTCLRPLLKFEKANTSLSIPEYKLDIVEELKVIVSKYEELQKLLDKLIAGSHKLGLESIISRSHHVLGRIDRMPISPMSAEQVQQRSDIFSKVLCLIDSLDSFNAPKDSAGPSDAVGLDSLLADVELHNESSDDEINIALNSTRLPTSSHSSQPVQKWNLKFSGDAKGISIHNFLERVEELRVARNVSEPQLFESAIDLFEGKALLWFRSNKFRISSWKDLRGLLIRHYEPPDYKDRLFDEILARTQDPTESFIEYFSCMLSMFRRYGTVSEDVQLRLISKNLAPFYTMQLPLVNSLSELEDECLKLERKKFRADSYRPPSRKRNTFVEPDFAFVGTDDRASSSRRVTINENVNVVTDTPISQNVCCYNCGQPGHRFQNCTAPRRRFCFKCGKVDVTVRTCSNCNRSENRRGRR